MRLSGRVPAGRRMCPPVKHQSVAPRTIVPNKPPRLCQMEQPCRPIESAPTEYVSNADLVKVLNNGSGIQQAISTFDRAAAEWSKTGEEIHRAIVSKFPKADGS